MREAISSTVISEREALFRLFTLKAVFVDMWVNSSIGWQASR